MKSWTLDAIVREYVRLGTITDGSVDLAVVPLISRCHS
jgi:hypothetical protein